MTVTFDPGPQPELAWLPISGRSVDPSYQRTLESRASQKVIDRIAESFCWRFFGVVTAAEKTETAWVLIDGQHRVEAARRIGIEVVPALIVPAPTRDEQAQVFLAVNRQRVAINHFAMHYASVAAGEQIAVDTQALADQAGIEIPRYPIPKASIKPGQTMALGTIKAASASGKGTRAVILVGQAWRTKLGGIPAGVLKAAWLALEEQVPADNVSAWLQRHRADDMSGVASTARVHEFVAGMRRSFPASPNMTGGLSKDQLMGRR